MAKREHRQRRCIVCRCSDAKEKLLRFVPHGTLIVWDKEQKLPGRGAYIHPALTCWSGLTERKRWDHAFRGAVAASAENIRALQEEIRGELTELRIGEDSKIRRRGKKVRL